MSKRTTDIVAYLTWIGLVIALLAGDRRNSRFHLNQALVLSLAGVALTIVYKVAYFLIDIASFGLLTGIIGALNAIISLVLLVLTIMGLLNALQGIEKPLPIIGGIHLI